MTSLQAGTNENTGDLLPHHRRMLLEGSAIAPEVVEARGYRTVRKKAELERLGFGRNQRHVPGLLIPIHGPAGDVVLHQYRPDEPRINKGKPVKYETPTGSKMVLDVPPFCSSLLGDPSIPLFVTEGIKKGDALASRGLCVVALLGVWNWRGTNEAGGKTSLPEWESVALNGREVYEVFDSDVMEKREVSEALRRLREFLRYRGADVWLIYLPHAAAATKQGVDDYLAAGHSTDDLLSHATTELKDPSQAAVHDAPHVPYRETPGGLVWDKPTQNGPIPTLLTNFAARIVRDVVEDDGAESRRAFEIEAALNGRRELFSVPSSQFAGMAWATEHLGAEAIVYPGFGAKDHARTAVQMLSGDVPAERRYSHTGWREIGDEWVYLHAGGAIGRVGRVQGIRTELTGVMAERVLPDPPEGEGVVPAIRASLGVLDLGPDRLMFPMFAAVYRAVLGHTDFGLHLSGPTGEGKSEIAALCQQHFGAGLGARNLASWESTENAIEGLAFKTKDQLMVLDDFAPSGSSYDVERLHRKADRILRAKGNASGRQRMRRDLSLIPDKPPRALVLSTGEDVPRGQSLRARLLVLELSPGELSWEKLTTCQREAERDIYASAVSGIVRWLAPRYGGTKGGLGEERAALREAAAATAQHRRTPGIVADLALGLRYFLIFAYEIGALTAEESEALWTRGWLALGEAAAEQHRHQEASEPTERFGELLAAAIASGRAHVAGRKGDEPETPDAWGWRAASVGSRDFQRVEWKPLGERVGWVEGEDLYLEPEAAYAAVQKQGRDSGDPPVISERTMRKRLHERGLLLSVENSRSTLTVRRMLDGRRRGVLHLSTGFFSPRTDRTDQPDHDHQKSLGRTQLAPSLWSGCGRKFDHVSDNVVPGQTHGQLAGQVKNNGDHGPDQRKVDKSGDFPEAGQVGQVCEVGSDDGSGSVVHYPAQSGANATW